MRSYAVYILSNVHRTVLYTGVTNDIRRRLGEHRSAEGRKSRFAHRYNATELVYIERYTSIRQAIAREKEIKGWRRAKKVELIQMVNPELRSYPL
ncbi:MAG: hypothetical protein RhofKO_13170 [Rhodothermales bacterium]